MRSKDKLQIRKKLNSINEQLFVTKFENEYYQVMYEDEDEDGEELEGDEELVKKISKLKDKLESVRSRSK